MNKHILGLTLAVSALVMTPNAQAAFVSDSFAIAHQTTDLNVVGSLNQFDGGLGTLNSVSLTLTGESISSAILKNNANQSQTFKFVSELDWLFEVLAGSAPIYGFTTTLASTSGFVTLASGVSSDLGQTVDSGSFNMIFTGADVAQFQGVGQVAVGCTTVTNTTFSGGGNINNQQTTTGACSGVIEYDYTASAPPSNVPEPTYLALLGIGLAAFGFARCKVA